MPDWIGDQMAGVGPEATRVFGRNAQEAGGQQGLGERVLSNPLLPFEVAPVREESARTGRSGRAGERARSTKRKFLFPKPSLRSFFD
jgi:hypothetical protein